MASERTKLVLYRLLFRNYQNVLSTNQNHFKDATSTELCKFSNFEILLNDIRHMI